MKHPYPTLRQLLLQGELQRMSDKLSKAQLNSVSHTSDVSCENRGRLPSYLAAKLCTSIINHTYVYIQYVYICIHMYTFVHRDTHAWIIYMIIQCTSMYIKHMDFFVSCCNGWTPCTTFLGPGLAARPSLNRK